MIKLSQFNQLKDNILKRIAPMVGETLTAALISSINEYEDAVEKSLARAEQKRSEYLEENTILRGISGVDDSELRQKFLQKAKESEFLTRDLLKERKTVKVLEDMIDNLKVEREELKNEINMLNAVKKSDDDRNLLALAEIKNKAVALEDRFRQEIKCAIEDNDMNLRLKDEECRNELNRILLELLKVIEAVKVELSWLDPVKGINSEERSSAYAKVHEMLSEISFVAGDSEIFMKEVDFMSIFGGLRKRYLDTAVKGGIKLIWPALKIFPKLKSDEKMIYEIVAILLDDIMRRSQKGSQISVSLKDDVKNIRLIVEHDCYFLKGREVAEVFIPFRDILIGHPGLSRAKRLSNKIGAKLNMGAAMLPGNRDAGRAVPEKTKTAVTLMLPKTENVQNKSNEKDTLI